MEELIKDTSTLKTYKSKLPSLIRDGKTAELAQTYKRIADYYYKNWYSDSLAFYYKHALEQYKKVRDSFYIFYCYSRIGEEIAYSGKDPDASLSWHLPAADYFERHKHYILAAHSNYAISTIYRSAKQPDKRMHYLDNAKRLNKIGKDTLLEIIMLENHANELREDEHWEEAHAETLKGVELSRKIGQKLFLKVGLLQMGIDFLHADQTEKAIAALKESLSINAITRGAVPEAYRLLTICYIRLNNGREAEKYLSLYKSTTDSIVKRREKDNYDELLIQYETEKKQGLIQALEQENKLKAKIAGNQKLFIGGLAAGLVVLLGAGWMMVRNTKNRRTLENELHQQQEKFSRQLQEQKEEQMQADFNKQLAEVQLTALSAQMNPHFIFNCMNSIQKYILKNEKSKALDFLQHFSELMRSVLDNSAKTKIELDEEISMLEKYILLEQQRLEMKFDYAISVAPDLQTDFFEIPGMIIQPYVENAIWHGIMNLTESASEHGMKPRKGMLELSFAKQGPLLKCVVIDNGVGRKTAAEMERGKSPKRKGYGMTIAKKRLELLQQQNLQVPEITVEDLYEAEGSPAGTRVTIFFHVD